MNTMMHSTKFRLHWVLSTIVVFAFQAPGPGDFLKRPTVPPKTVARSEAMAAYVIAKTFDLSDESLREFETRYNSVVKGEDSLARVAEYASADGLSVRIEDSDSTALIGEFGQNASMILVVTKAGYVAICHPKTSGTSMIVTTAFNGMERIDWDDWDGRYLVAKREVRELPSSDSKILIAVSLCLILGIISISIYMLRKRT